MHYYFFPEARIKKKKKKEKLYMYEVIYNLNVIYFVSWKPVYTCKHTTLSTKDN